MHLRPCRSKPTQGGTGADAAVFGNKKNKIIMKNLYKIWLFLFLFSCTSSSTTTKKQYNFIKTFEGEIGNKYQIIAKFRCENGAVTGNYYYKNKGQEIIIKGEINNNKVILKEFDKIGNQTGNFEGNFEGDNKISGIWSKPNGNNQVNFVLLETNTDYNSVLNEFQELKSIIGRYDSPFNDGGISSGTVMISNVRDDKFDFEITTAHAQGCTGEAKGTATITRNKVGKYSEKNCKNLEFQFFPGEVKIEENKCELHGIRCSFSGSYNKKM